MKDWPIWRFYALVIGLGLARFNSHLYGQLMAKGFYALVIGLGLARDADFRPL